ncbi:hypothetical protein SCOCK_220144 [Actinacidiphila cocklensis]|uniref:Uncharacterized protein n=1 Tax=Actinacidiphila cocklensis TaxID=887465 RepID=A0A9W4DM10_9ACTN|nr:hypothetical protein SCOCK_220144 [Actinacidiphila cocklensis]
MPVRVRLAGGPHRRRHSNDPWSSRDCPRRPACVEIGVRGVATAFRSGVAPLPMSRLGTLSAPDKPPQGVLRDKRDTAVQQFRTPPAGWRCWRPEPVRRYRGGFADTFTNCSHRPRIKGGYVMFRGADSLQGRVRRVGRGRDSAAGGGRPRRGGIVPCG